MVSKLKTAFILVAGVALTLSAAGPAIAAYKAGGALKATGAFLGGLWNNGIYNPVSGIHSAFQM